LLDPATVTWQRALDVNDKGLAHIVTGLGNPPQAPQRETGFDLTAASEVMAILALATSFTDLRRRLGQIVVGLGHSDDPVFGEQTGCAGSTAALLRDAARANLVQTCEHRPALVHAGPFGNIAHGNCSILADYAAARLADFVITESGFGADCGAEKFFNIQCRTSGMKPAAEVLVCTVRVLKLYGGRFAVQPGKPLPAALRAEDLSALRAGAESEDAIRLGSVLPECLARRGGEPSGPPRHHSPVPFARRGRRQPLSQRQRGRAQRSLPDRPRQRSEFRRRVECVPSRRRRRGRPGTSRHRRLPRAQRISFPLSSRSLA
jgi:formate--tetrahydrofolate ligase